MVKIDILYEGNLRCKLTHEPSGDQIFTDAPKDNMGKGEAFSPTDLLASALGSCMLTVMGITAQKNQLNMNGATATVLKEMVAAPVRRVAKVSIAIEMPAGIPKDKRKLLEDAGMNCPVIKSLNPDVSFPIEFKYLD